jgi:hypothetical protein
MKESFFIIIIPQSIVLFVFIKNLIVKYVDETRFNIFYLMLIFYNLLTISKFLNFILGFADATAFFVITTIAQIIFGLFFSIFREDNSKLIL